jgi:predicted nucleic acid-binding protein
MKCLDTNAVIAVINDRPAGARSRLAQELASSATLVTADEREFARVPGLDVMDWATPKGNT